MLVFLIGMMGSGKTTVGQYLASRLSIPFYDTDYLIEKATGETVSSLFESHGEAFFRGLEAQLMNQWAMDEGVVATGGGLPYYSGLMERLNTLGITVYLDCPVEVLVSRLQGTSNRPLLANDATEINTKLASILSTRENIYQKSQWCVDASKDARSVAEGILTLLKSRNQPT